MISEDWLTIHLGSLILLYKVWPCYRNKYMIIAKFDININNIVHLVYLGAFFQLLVLMPYYLSQASRQTQPWGQNGAEQFKLFL